MILPISAIAANWQWNRHIAREARNTQIASALAASPVSYPGPLTDGYQDRDQFMRVTVRGEWLSSEQMYVRKTVVNGSVGFGVVTPFKSDDGTLLFVVRGWAPEPTARLPRSKNEVTVRIDAVRNDGASRPSDLPPGQVNWVEPSDLAGGRPYANAVFDLVEPTPTDLVALPAPEQSSGPHVGYTIHWILIGLAAVIIYGRLVRREFQDDEN